MIFCKSNQKSNSNKAKTEKGCRPLSDCILFANLISSLHYSYYSYCKD